MRFREKIKQLSFFHLLEIADRNERAGKVCLVVSLLLVITVFISSNMAVKCSACALNLVDVAIMIVLSVRSNRIKEELDDPARK